MPSLIRLAERLDHEARRPAAEVALVAALVIYGVVLSHGNMGDYAVYHRAAERMLAGEDVYRLEDDHRYLYAPVLVFTFVPFVFLGDFSGRALWFLLNVLLAVRVYRLSLLFSLGAGRAPPGLVVLLVLLTLRFLDNNMGHGQMNLVLLWLVLESYALAGRGRFVPAGIALAGAVCIKIFPLVCLLQLALRRQWRFLVATVAGGGALLLFPVLWWQDEYPDVVRDWLAVVVDHTDHYDLTDKINQSISAFVFRLFRPYSTGSPLVELSPEVVTVITILVHLLFVVPLVLVSRRNRAEREPEGPGGAELGLWLLYGTVLLPYSWKYYFVNLIPSLAVLLRRLWSSESRGLALAVVAVFLLNLLPGQRFFGTGIGLLFQQWSFHFLSLVIVFVALLPKAFRPSA